MTNGDNVHAVLYCTVCGSHYTKWLPAQPDNYVVPHEKCWQKVNILKNSHRQAGTGGAEGVV